ncbi:MAG: GMP synthase [Alphaproteobacteria bacterium]|nr:GMP synthase [Alphaproteobacteria bacterium]
MNILCLTHADFETPGVIEEWAFKRGYGFNICRPYKGETLQNAQNFDFLIIMGGPQSPLALDKDPYLKEEIVCIKQAISADKLILGFCLGAQLIGEALGAKTMRSPEKEVGVYPITLSEEGMKDPLLQGFESSFSVIHWHNDMPGMTNEAVLLASSLGCPRQIIRYSPKIYGFQCHLEITQEGMKDLIAAAEHDLAPSPYTQTSTELLQQNYHDINQKMIQILDRYLFLNEQNNELRSDGNRNLKNALG